MSQEHLSDQACSSSTANNCGYNETERKSEEELLSIFLDGEKYLWSFTEIFKQSSFGTFLQNEKNSDKYMKMIFKAMSMKSTEREQFLKTEGKPLVQVNLQFNELKEMLAAEVEIDKLLQKARTNPLGFFFEFMQTELYQFLKTELDQTLLMSVVTMAYGLSTDQLKEFLRSGDGKSLLNAVMKFQRQKANQTEALCKRGQGEGENTEVPRKKPMRETEDRSCTESPAAQVDNLETKFFACASTESLEGNVEAVKNFIKCVGGDRVVRCMGEKQTPLATAAERGDYEEVSRLIQDGADVNAVHPDDEYRMTPLMMAAISNNEMIAKLLIENGANVNQLEYCHASALHYASRRGYPKVVDVLVENKANIHLKDCEHFKPVHAARDGLGRYLPAFMRPNMDERREILDIYEDIIFNQNENMEVQDFTDDYNEFLTEERRTQWFVLRRSPLYEADVRLMTNVFQFMRSSNYYKDSATPKL